MTRKTGTMRPAIVAWAGSAAILASLALDLSHRPVARNGSEPTVLSGTTSDPATADRALRFLETIREELPPGASIALVWAKRRTTRDDMLDFLLAIGQLPEQNVVFAPGEGGTPEYVASFQGGFEDPRYAQIRAFAEGRLYRLAR